MRLSWSDLRALNGSQAVGFEELCSQLARFEAPDGAEFVRTGSPDGGVECYCRLEDGREWGWQAKFFDKPLRDPQWNQLDRSVKAALEAHPDLVRYFVCVPRDRSDGRRSGVTTELQRWESRVAKWGSWAKQRGMTVEFVWWGGSELLSLLSQDAQAGLVRFWFGRDQFSDEWFDHHLQLAISAAGPRYTPEVHVDMPLVRDFDLFGRREVAVAEVRRLANSVRHKPARMVQGLVGDGAVDGLTELCCVDELIADVDKALKGASCPPDADWPLSDIVTAIDELQERLSACEAPLEAAAARHDQSGEPENEPRGYGSNPYGEVAHHVRASQNALWEIQHMLRKFEQVVNSDLMVVTGDAGVGKTHLLCDVAKSRLAQHCPTVVLMGQQFTTNDPPWVQARALMDLDGMPIREFVGALEAAAQATGSRALFIIDAINEGAGHEIWPQHLASLLAQLGASPWVGVVLSVRTPYVDRIIPTEVKSSAYELPHEGFKGNTYAAVERFCEHYGLDFPATPLLRPDFDSPLFLKTLCEGLSHRRLRRIPVGSEGISAVLGRYLDAVDAELAERLDYDPQAGTVTRALDAIASELAAQGTRWLLRSRAQELVNALTPEASGFSRTLYRALVDKGLITELPDASRDDERIVQIGYEWFADYLIAKHLIGHFEDADTLIAALARADADSSTAAWALWYAPLEALSILLPEQLGIELPEVLTASSTRSYVMRAFLKGLTWRDPATISRGCQELVEDLLDAAAQHWDIVDIFDALVTCAIVPDHPLGSAFLDKHLRGLGMPDRDAAWSAYLYLAYSRSGPLNRLLDWAEKHSARSTGIDDGTAQACSTVLAWCLTASHRFVRDRATKGLVALLSGDVELTCELVRRFDDVDDPYVRERVMAAAYGVAMRSSDALALAPLADLVYGLIFADGEPPAHILLRDYARGVIERALHLGTDIVAHASIYEPPYRSAWPRIPEASELERHDPFRQDHQEEPSEAERAQGRLYSSVMRMDFARYVIGTNSSSESYRWLSVTNEEPLWRSEEELKGSFRRSLGRDLRETFDVLWPHTRPRRRFFEADPPEAEPEARATNELPASPEAQESDLVRLLEELPQRLEEMFVSMLDEEQSEAYEQLKASHGRTAPRLRLDIIQRYVLWRAFDLGWTMERFGYLDWLITSSASYEGAGRADHKPERIGKKYQWIAYHEILAHISDRYQYWLPYDDAGPQNAYMGSWQLYLRDIDPSSVHTGASLDSERRNGCPKWWRHEVIIDSVDDATHDKWLRRESDIPDEKQQLCFTDPDDGSTWIKLQGMNIWQSLVAPGYDRDDVDDREIWLEANGYLISASHVEEFVSWSTTVDFWNRWMPESPRAHSLFFGELGWSLAFKALVGDAAEPQRPAPENGARCPIPLQPAAYRYVAEGRGYDCSLADSYELHRPNAHLVEAMNLRWTGNGADYVDADGVLVAFDPAAHDDGASTLLMREDSLVRFLDETGSALVWAITGEKSAHGPGWSRDAWAGSLRLTGGATFMRGGPMRRRFTSNLELPNRDQN